MNIEQGLKAIISAGAILPPKLNLRSTDKVNFSEKMIPKSNNRKLLINLNINFEDNINSYKMIKNREETIIYEN
jgi:hypothetical protein